MKTLFDDDIKKLKERLNKHELSLAEAEEAIADLIFTCDTWEEMSDEDDHLINCIMEPPYELARLIETGIKVHDGRTNLAGYWRWGMWMDCYANYPDITELIAQGNCGAAFEIGRLQEELAFAREMFKLRNDQLLDANKEISQLYREIEANNWPGN